MIKKSTTKQMLFFKVFITIVLDRMGRNINRIPYFQYFFSDDIKQTSRYMSTSTPYSKYSLNNWTFMSAGIDSARSEILTESKNDPTLRPLVKKRFGNVNYDVHYFMDKAKKHLKPKTFSKLEKGEMILQWNKSKMTTLKKLQKLHKITQLCNVHLFQGFHK